MEVKFDPQQGAVEDREERLYFKSPDWILTENIFAGIGSMPLWIAFWYWRLDTVPPWNETMLVGAVVSGLLCALRFGADEIALFLRIVITQALIAYRRAEIWYNEQELNEQIDFLIAECEKEKAINQQLRGELSATKKKVNRYDAGANFTPATPSPSERASFDAEPADPWEGYIDPSAFMQEEDETEEDELLSVDDSARVIDLDESVESGFEAALELIEHYERHGNLSKKSAREKSSIGSKRWAKAKETLIDSGAARIDPKEGLIFVQDSIMNVELALDRYREQLARQLH